MTRDEVLSRAMSAVSGDRDHNYGGPEDSFLAISAMWNIYLTKTTGAKVVLGPSDVAAMMALLKIVRIAASPDHEDSWVDLAGYAACGGEISCVGSGDQ